MLNVHPRQTEKSNVVDDEVKVLPLELLVPADQHVPTLDLSRCRGQSETRHDLTIDENLVLQMLSNQPGMP